MSLRRSLSQRLAHPLSLLSQSLSLSMFIAEIWIPSSFYVISNPSVPFLGIGSTHCQEWDVGGFIGSPEHFIAALSFPIHLISALISSLLLHFFQLKDDYFFTPGLKPIVGLMAWWVLINLAELGGAVAEWSKVLPVREKIKENKWNPMFTHGLGKKTCLPMGLHFIVKRSWGRMPPDAGHVFIYFLYQ